MIKKLTVNGDEVALNHLFSYMTRNNIEFSSRSKEEKTRKSKGEDSEEMIAIQDLIYPSKEDGILMTATEITVRLSKICGEDYNVIKVGASLRRLGYERCNRNSDKLKCYKVKFR